MSVKSRIAKLALDDRTVGVRDRLRTAAPAFVVFVVAGAFAETAFWTQWWFYVGTAMSLSAVFLEPYFGTARIGMANSAAAVGAYWSADRPPLQVLWAVFLFASLSILVSALLAAILPGASVAKSLFNRLAQFGVAVLLGGIALGLESASRIAQGNIEYLGLGIGTAILVAGLTLRWSQVVGSRSRTLGTYVVDSIGPGRLLLEGIADEIGAGESVRFSDGTLGVIENRLPSSLGARATIAIAGNWRAVAAVLPTRVVLQKIPPIPLVGIAGAGTSPTVLTFSPSVRLTPGAPVSIASVDGDPVLFQVMAESLVEERWEDSKSIVPVVSARQVGRLRDGVLALDSQLPEPHAPVLMPTLPPSSVPSTHFRIGKLKGTEVEIGVAFDPSARGHLAVLGMSGMGKTSVARRICEQLGLHQPVVGLDVTGEYRTRLAFPTWTPGDYSTAGHFVHEPTGDPAAQAEVFVRELMSHANTEYIAGTVNNRVIALEEAHAFVPEWNFASKLEADKAALTARYVMQSRKFGVSFLVVSQRTAVVSKSVLSQCESLIVLRTVDDTSLSYIETIVGPIARSVLPSLRRHEALCFGPGFNSDGPTIVELDPPPAGLTATTTTTATAPF